MTTAPLAQDTSTTILVLHAPDLDPRPFISRLIISNPSSAATNDGDDDDDDVIPWTIDNKYYSADVAFRPHALDLPSPDSHPAVIYIFHGEAPDPLPPALTRLAVTDPPPDIALAVRLRVPGSTTKRTTNGGGEWHGESDDVFDSDRLEEIGLEVIDEGGTADDDDERPLDPLDTVRQTLMTHMWPNMRRKATGPRLNIPRPEVSATGEDSDEEGLTVQATGNYAQFPVGFRSASMPEPLRAAGPVSDFPAPNEDDDTDWNHQEESSPPFLPVDSGYEPVPDDEFGEFSAPAPEEYARLDEWLDGDMDAPPELATMTTMELETSGLVRPNPTAMEEEQKGFDDNFSTSATAASGAGGLPLDPTPLLLHLQSVRAELAQVGDEDERRARAGAEVARLMQSLGMGGGDWEDELAELELEDFGPV